MSGVDKCPLCGSRVLYRGLASLECAGAPKSESFTLEPGGYRQIPVPAQPACPNYKPQRVKVSAAAEEFDWYKAVELQLQGLPVQYMHDTGRGVIWLTGVPTCMPGSGPNYVWRIRP